MIGILEFCQSRGFTHLVMLAENRLAERIAAYGWPLRYLGQPREYEGGKGIAVAAEITVGPHVLALTRAKTNVLGTMLVEIDSGRFAAFKDISSYIFVYQAVPDVIQSLLNKGVSPASVKGLIDATLAKWDSNKIESKKTAVAIDIADMLDTFPALKLAMAPMGMELDQNTQLAVYATGCRPMARENQGAGKSTMCTTAAWLESEESEYNPNQPFRTEGLFPTDVAVHIILHQAGAAAAAAGVTEGMMQRNACRGKFPSSLAVVYMLFN